MARSGTVSRTELRLAFVTCSCVLVTHKCVALSLTFTQRSSPSTSSSSKGCGSDKSSSTSAKMPRVLKAVEASSSAGSSKLILPGQTLNTQKEVKDAPAWSQSMEAECDGFWGGLLRHCWGVTTSHVVRGMGHTREHMSLYVPWSS